MQVSDVKIDQNKITELTQLWVLDANDNKMIFPFEIEKSDQSLSTQTVTKKIIFILISLI